MSAKRSSVTPGAPNSASPDNPTDSGTTNADMSEDDDYEFNVMENGKRIRITEEERHLLKSTFCEVCGGLLPFEDNPILLCDGSRCTRAYHIKCLSPPLESVPEGDFLGPCCSASMRTNMKPSSAIGRAHLRRSRLLNRSQGKDIPGGGPVDSMPVKGLFNQLSQSFSNRRRSTLVESIDDILLPRPRAQQPQHLMQETIRSSVSDQSPTSMADSTDSAPVAVNSWHKALADSHQKLIEDLQCIVGMDRVKELLVDINSKIHLRKERIRRSSVTSSGQPGQSTGMAPHIALIGNPGTGKSMIGRILAKMLHRSHAVERNVFVKAHRSDLVAGYIGQTAMKTAQLIEQARGGIMFIDEAHQLVNPNKEDYGIEAYREIMKEMLSERPTESDRVTFIFAGYPKQMSRFLKFDAGMESRVSFRIQLPDYTLGEVVQICHAKLESRNPIEGLPTAMEPGVHLEHILRILPANLVTKYNARLADLLLDQAEASLARRALQGPVSADGDMDISVLREVDFKQAATNLRYEMLQSDANRSPQTSDSE